eukprot:228782-Amphidinium_carterae.1
MEVLRIGISSAEVAGLGRPNRERSSRSGSDSEHWRDRVWACNPFGGRAQAPVSSGTCYCMASGTCATSVATSGC